jgi:O-antigen/teichoic acid export membrane protein/aminoglycoside phosphotransferase
VLGLNSAAISAMMFISGVAQLNLMSALTRFIPVSGRKTSRFVVSSYLLSVATAAVVALVFLVGLDLWAPALSFLTSSPGFVVWFVAATMAWCVFNLQDSVLTGLRAAVFVPLENLVYSMLKIGLLVAFVSLSPRYGIFASWTAGLIASLVLVNLLVFGRLLPTHAHGGDERPPTRRQLATFVSADYLGALFWLGATTLMPLLVVALKGATANAYFSLAWMIALPLFAISASTGAVLVVAASRDEARLSGYARRVLIQTCAIVVPLALVLALSAPWLLDLFGPQYAAHSHTTLSLLALAAIPNAVTAIYVSAYRVQRRMSAVVMLLASLCGLVLGLGVALMELLGIAGIGLAWLIAESLVAAVLLVVDASRETGGVSLNLAADLGLLRLLARVRRGPAAWRRARETTRLAPKVLACLPPDLYTDPPASWAANRCLTTVSDMSVITVGPSGLSPTAVIKLPATPLAVRSLRREREVLAAFHADARLRGWCRILPTVLAEGELAGRAYLVEQMLPGVPATGIKQDDAQTTALLTTAAAAIGELHRRTARAAAVDSAMFERWIDGPALVVRGVGATAAGDGRAIDRLTAELHAALDGRTLPLSWVHGDFVLSNILVSADGTAVLGIVDWELAAAKDVPSIDLVSLLVSARAQRQRREVGHVVRELVNGGPWTESEQALLDSGELGRPSETVDTRTLVLLWWLRHVAGNLTKSTRYGRRGLWARWNIQTVLDTLGGR